MVGATLGHYRIVRLVGTGGMGEVYAAEDLTLGRTVAIKVLPSGLQAGADELERFAREAKSVAALNHRAIVTLHSFEQAEGTYFITMELVDGQPLSGRLGAKALAFDEVLRVGIELADAIASAHERGIIHRDLKPANVLVRADGQIKILDFGLAKLRQSESLGAELPTSQLTGEGKIVGTVAYMSPEQAEGRDVDHRTDIFSMGVLLYELATGQRPFRGDTSLSVLSAVLKDQPRPASELNPAVPSAFARVLKTCLQKDPERRYQTAKDLRNELQTLKEEMDSGELARAIAAAPASAAPGRSRWPLYAGAAGLIGVIALAAVFWPWSRPSVSEGPPVVLQHTRLTSASGVESMPALSPDGKWFVYVSTAAGNPDIYLQSVGGQTAINLTKDSLAIDDDLAFSPDGERIAFRSTRDGGGLFVMGRTGEAPRRVGPGGRNPAWSPDGQSLVFSTVSTNTPTNRVAAGFLRVIRIDSGEVRDLTTQDALHPSWSPNGNFIAFWGLDQAGESLSSKRDLWVVAASGGAPWRLTDDAFVDWSPMWAPEGRAIYFGSNRGGSMNLWRIAVDPDTARAAGEPQPVTTPAGYVGQASLASTGTSLVYESRETTSNIYRSTFDAARLVVGDPVAVTTGSRTFRFVDSSPDGQRLVLATSFLQQEDLFISNADGSELRQLTTDAYNDRAPQWSPNGEAIAFYSDRSGQYDIWTTSPSGQLRRVTEAKDWALIFPRWSPSGRSMTGIDTIRGVVAIFDPSKPWNDQKPDILPPVPGLKTSFTLRQIVWSPDESQLAGAVNNTWFIYDIATRQYREVPNLRGNVFAWLKGQGLLVASKMGLNAVDPLSGAGRPLVVPDASPFRRMIGLTAAEPRLSPDEKTLFIALEVNESDLWLVTLGK